MWRRGFGERTRLVHAHAWCTHARTHAQVCLLHMARHDPDEANAAAAAALWEQVGWHAWIGCPIHWVIGIRVGIGWLLWMVGCHGMGGMRAGEGSKQGRGK